MVKFPKEMLDYNKNAAKAKDRIMKSRCKICGKTMEEGGISGTARICASCLRGEQ